MTTISPIHKWLVGAFSGLLVLALTAGAFVIIPAAPAYAETEDPPQAERSRDRGTLLEQAFEREKDWLDRQGNNLDRAAAAADRLGNLIEKVKAHGVDTGDLESALGAFERQLASAEAAHDQAAAILAAHAGFNGGGKVTDPEQARETVRRAGAALREAMEILQSASHDLRDAVEAWRAAHPRPQAEMAPSGA